MASRSQVDPLPQSLPFDIISKTIGCGAYASVKKGRSSDGSIFAVKFIHKQSAYKNARLSPRQLRSEANLHEHCGAHANIIRFFATGEDEVWIWIAMEFASGGDLFDKIEADQGVPEDIAHFYFTQLVSGVSWIHGMGVAHRDIKPENILLDADGNLKLADFGLAVVFHYQGNYRDSESVCGSPPYIAPEISHGKYRGDRVDIWSCGVVLFVLLAGNTPWDEPTHRSPEYVDFVQTEGRPSYEPWPDLPQETLSLLRGMMRLDPSKRFTFENIRQHPWFTRPNPVMSQDGRCVDGIGLAARLMENLHIDFSKTPSIRASHIQNKILAGADVRLSSTQPVAPVNNIRFEWEKPQHNFASQPTETADKMEMAKDSESLWAYLSDDPTMSQFAPQPHLSESLTQRAKRFNDICPLHRLTRFYSPYSIQQLLPILAGALHRLGIAVPSLDDNRTLEDGEVWIPIKTEDTRRCPLRGEIVVHQLPADMLEVSFSKNMGDPLEWRRFFKDVVVLAKEAVYTGQ
ncbi:Pkinase-domain-containing protein [Ascodesmis nigricans]|uniref:Pkinase-domain-containing protein n=1 Tax=Ascodesmis nigricans TaxID=341454 RepID=A0A4S2N6B5_9PEZI|nr:Pkinase-domain-containing protein [Ascodesmis nigricans]